MMPVTERGNSHRALSLTIDLNQAMAEDLVGLIEIREIHRATSIDDRF